MAASCAVHCTWRDTTSTHVHACMHIRQFGQVPHQHMHLQNGAGCKMHAGGASIYHGPWACRRIGLKSSPCFAFLAMPGRGPALTAGSVDAFRAAGNESQCLTTWSGQWIRRRQKRR